MKLTHKQSVRVQLLIFYDEFNLLNVIEILFAEAIHRLYQDHRRVIEF